jgi:hypothetical protein
VKNYFECKYCFKKYTSEKLFNKHECKEMRIEKLMRSNTGMAAYEIHCEWRRARGMAPLSKERFSESRALTSMVKFVKFSKRVALPARSKFIKYMSELGIHAKDWCNNKVYEHYISKFDELVTPEEQADVTLETINQLAKIYRCETGDVLAHMLPDTAIKLMQARKFSPWVMLLSTKFHSFMMYGMSPEQRALLEVYVDPKIWNDRLKENPEFTNRMKKIVKSLGL